MYRHIIREVPAEYSELSFYFDGDTFNQNAGDYCYNLFIVQRNRHGLNGINTEEYERLTAKADAILDGFSDVEDGVEHWDGSKLTYQEVMQDENIPYSDETRDALIAWCYSGDSTDVDSMADLLTILTGHKWEVTSAAGYCQGDYCQILYCPGFNSQDVAHQAGEIYLGAAKEFCVIDLDEDGNEIDSCYGFIVADSQARTDEDYKILVAGWNCLKLEDTRLEMIDGYHTYTKYDYRVA